MLGHLGVNVPDLEAARSYYGELMPLLDFEVFLDEADQFAFRPTGAKPGTYLFFYPATEPAPYSRERTGLQHLAFMVPTRARVSEVHDRAVELGATSLHRPQDWPQYPPPYHAAFWTDPVGLVIEAVCHKDR